MGEMYGHMFVEDVLGYECKLEPTDKKDSLFFPSNEDSKSFSQGFDAIYWDKLSQEFVIAEMKGQSSKLSDAQKEFDYVLNVCQKITEGKGIYANPEDLKEYPAVKEVFDHYNNGGTVRFEVIRTKFNRKDNSLFSVIEQRAWLSNTENVRQKMSRGKHKTERG